MNKIDRDKFLFLYQDSFGQLQDAPKAGLLQVVGFLESDDKITDVRHAAYLLATVRHETARTYQSIPEDGKGAGKAYGKPHPVTGKIYYGRSYPQVTWYDNYLAMQNAWNRAHPDRPVDFVRNPDSILVPEHGYWCTSYGMRTGAFTGVGLSHFIHGDVCDFLNARKIINGLDCAEKIAGAAEKILVALQGAAA